MIPKPFEVLDCGWLKRDGRQVVIPHQTRGLLLVPCRFIDKYDNQLFKITHGNAMYKLASSIDDKEWVHVGWLGQVWKIVDDKNYEMSVQ